MIIELVYLFRIGLSFLLGLIIGIEREQQDKPAGLRTILFIMVGATLTVVFSLRYLGITGKFDAIRAIAYYLVAIGFVGGGIIGRKNGKVEGITTAALLLPISLIGFLCGIGDYFLAICSGIIIYIILKLKYIKVKIMLVKKIRSRNAKKRKS